MKKEDHLCLNQAHYPFSKSLVLGKVQNYPTDVIQRDQKAFLGSHLKAINRTTQHRPVAEIYPPHDLGLKGSPWIESEERVQSHCTLPKVLACCKNSFNP